MYDHLSIKGVDTFEKWATAMVVSGHVGYLTPRDKLALRVGIGVLVRGKVKGRNWISYIIRSVLYVGGLHPSVFNMNFVKL